MCAEQELVVGNSLYKKKVAYKYTWLRIDEGGRVVDRALIDYVLQKTNAWKTVRCVCVDRRRWRNN